MTESFGTYLILHSKSVPRSLYSPPALLQTIRLWLRLLLLRVSHPALGGGSGGRGRWGGNVGRDIHTFFVMFHNLTTYVSITPFIPLPLFFSSLLSPLSWRHHPLKSFCCCQFFCMMLGRWVYVIIHLFRPTTCTTPRSEA